MDNSPFFRKFVLEIDRIIAGSQGNPAEALKRLEALYLHATLHERDALVYALIGRVLHEVVAMPSGRPPASAARPDIFDPPAEPVTEEARG